MFLNFKRSPVSYWLFNLLTLGLYQYYFISKIVNDTNKACRDHGQKTKLNIIVFFILNVLTIGIYGMLLEITLIKRWNSYLQNGYGSIDISNYRVLKLLSILVPMFFSLLNFFLKFNEILMIVDIPQTKFLLSVLPFVIFISICILSLLPIRKFVSSINVVCKTFSDEALSDDSDDAYYLKPKAKKPVQEDDPSVIAGVPVVEEYFVPEHIGQGRTEYVIPEKTKKVRDKEIIDDPVIDTENHYRNKKWFRRVFVPMLALFMAPLLMVSVITFFLPPVYENTFVGELGEKYELLCKTNDPKIVVIGGSSVAFGLDSALMEEHLGMKVVNFGLYANLGTKLMMDLSKANINKGDVIILAPELDSQTLSLFFNSETTIQALDGNWNMLLNIDTSNYSSLLGATWKFSTDKLNYLIDNKKPANDGAYKKENFNEYGDNIYDRPNNVMVGTVGTITLDFRYNPESSSKSDYEKFIDYVNEYVAWANRRGATVYFSFPPMALSSMSNKNTEDSIFNFYTNLGKYLNCKIISSIDDYIIDSVYFFDSEFHLNNSGVILRTVLLIDDVKRELGITTLTMKYEDIPKPAYGEFDFEPGNEDNLHYILELYYPQAGNDKLQFYKIVGLTQEGLNQTELTIPNNVDGIPVVGIAEDAFYGSSLTKLNVSKNIRLFESFAFRGASNLIRINLPSNGVPSDIQIPIDNLATDGANPSLKIYVPSNMLSEYASDYFWTVYASLLMPL